MTNFTAFTRSQRNGNIKVIKDTLQTKSEFAKELRSNGFRIIVILNDYEINNIKEHNHYKNFDVYDYIINNL
jgi:hypothetical protein